MAEGFVYFISNGEGLVKIGVTNNVQQRLVTLQTASPRKLHVIASVDSKEPYRLESKLHRNFSSQWIHGEWFRLDDQEVEFVIRELGMGFALPAYPGLIKMLEHFSKTTQRMANSDRSVQDANGFYGKYELMVLEKRIVKLQRLDRHDYHKKLIVLSETLHNELFMLYQANGYPPYYDVNLQKKARDIVGLMESIKTHLLLWERPRLTEPQELAGWFK